MFIQGVIIIYWTGNFDNIFTFQNGFFSANEKYKMFSKGEI